MAKRKKMSKERAAKLAIHAHWDWLQKELVRRGLPACDKVRIHLYYDHPPRIYSVDKRGNSAFDIVTMYKTGAYDGEAIELTRKIVPIAKNKRRTYMKPELPHDYDELIIATSRRKPILAEPTTTPKLLIKLLYKLRADKKRSTEHGYADIDVEAPNFHELLIAKEDKKLL